MLLEYIRLKAGEENLPCPVSYRADAAGGLQSRRSKQIQIISKFQSNSKSLYYLNTVPEEHIYLLLHITATVNVLK